MQAVPDHGPTAAVKPSTLPPCCWPTGEKSHMSVKGLFYGIGHRPNSDLLQGYVELDEKGYVKVSQTKSQRKNGEKL